MAFRRFSPSSEAKSTSKDNDRKVPVEDPGYNTDDIEKDFGVDIEEPEPGEPWYEEPKPIRANPISSAVPRSKAIAWTELTTSTSSFFLKNFDITTIVF